MNNKTGFNFEFIRWLTWLTWLRWLSCLYGNFMLSIEDCSLVIKMLMID